MPQFLDSLSILCFAGLMIWAAATDVRRYIIPNRICVAVAALYPAYVLAVHAAGGTPVPWPWSLLFAGVMFVVGIFLFAIGALGGGDVKLLSAVTLWAGPSLFLAFLFVTAVAGAGLALIYALKTCVDAIQRRADGSLSMRSLAAGLADLRHVPLLKLTVPYGVAIAVGGLYVGANLAIG